mgnify:CR=1 FL=1
MRGHARNDLTCPAQRKGERKAADDVWFLNGLDMRVAIHLKVSGPDQGQPVPVEEETAPEGYGVKVRRDRERVPYRDAMFPYVAAACQDRSGEHVRQCVQ